jgi:hypothetical protein
MNLFDGIQKSLINTVNNTFGYMVSWTPAAGGPAKIAKCLYKDPSEKYQIGEVKYFPNSFQFEYKNEDLIGLYEAVQANETDERIFIYEIGSDISTAIEYQVKSFRAKFDGKIYHAYIEKII